MTSTSLFMLFLVMVLCQRGTSQQTYAVYVNSSSGTLTTTCWTGGMNIPCRRLETVLIETRMRNQKSEALTSWRNCDLEDMECPTWMHYSNETGQCVCESEHHGMVKCNATLNQTYILDCHRMTYDEEKQQVIAGLSFYGCMNQAQLNEIYHLVPDNRSKINEAMCGQFKRDGRLCGACVKGYSPLVYSYELYCKECSDYESMYNWAKYISVAFIPLTGFYIFVVLFKFNVNSPSLQAFVFFAQIIGNPSNMRIMSSGWKFGKSITILTKLLGTLYGIWNLDYFRTLYPDMCLRITTLQALTLDYVIAFYPLVLITITCLAIKFHSMEYRIMLWLWKPIKKCFIRFKQAENMKTSMIDVFATFLQLSYVKVLSVNFDLLAFTVPIDSSGRSVGRYLYYDASYEHFGRRHLPYGIIAILLFVIINVFPFVLLLFYPMKWFQIVLNRCMLSHPALHTFVDSFAGCYKDGTEQGARDCRYFAAFFLLLRICVYIVYQLTLTVSFYAWNGLIITAFTVVLAVVQPYKPQYKKYNIVTTAIFGVLILVTIATMNVNIALVQVHQTVRLTTIVVATLISLPQFYAIGLCMLWMYTKYGVFRKLFCKNRELQRDLSESSLLIASEEKRKVYKAIV